MMPRPSPALAALDAVCDFESRKSRCRRAYHEIVRKLTGGILQKLKSASQPKSRRSQRVDGAAARSATIRAGLPSMMEQTPSAATQARDRPADAC